MALSIIFNFIVYIDNEWKFYFIFGYFGDLTVPFVNCPVVLIIILLWL
jgi:hypothetical protein